MGYIELGGGTSPNVATTLNFGGERVTSLNVTLTLNPTLNLGGYIGIQQFVTFGYHVPIVQAQRDSCAEKTQSLSR